MLLQLGSACVYRLIEYLIANKTSALITIFVSIPFITILYDRCVHPLSEFPGPFFGSVTDIYKTYLFSTREFHLKLLALHEQYGQLPKTH